jgi:pimeloyl-ACP methyl ester carboxylesterase
LIWINGRDQEAISDRDNWDAGLAVALVDLWIIEYMTKEKMAAPKDVVVVGQSAGGWAAIALSSQNPPAVRAIITQCCGSTCIAADVADPKVVREMETGQKLVVEVVDANVLSVNQLASAQSVLLGAPGAPSGTFGQALDE